MSSEALLTTAVATLTTVVSALCGIVAFLYKEVQVRLKEEIANCEKERALEKAECREQLDQAKGLITGLQNRMDAWVRDYKPTLVEEK